MSQYYLEVLSRPAILITPRDNLILTKV